MSELPYYKVRVSEDEKREIDSRLGKQGRKAQGLLYGWLHEWLSGGRKTTDESIAAFDNSSNALHCKPENREWHEKLERVLCHGTERNRIGIEENLDWAVGNLEKGPTSRRKRAVNET